MACWKSSAALLAFLAPEGVSALRQRRRKSATSTELKIVSASKFFSGVPVLDEELAQAGHQDWIAFFAPGSTDADLAAFCETSIAESCSPGHPDEGGLPFVSLQSSEAALQVTLTHDGAKATFVVPDVEIEVDEEPDEVSAQASATWGVDRIGARRNSATGKGVNVYVLDSGVRCSHKEFGGRCVPTLEAGSRIKECNGDMSCAKDGRGHGTHCAGSVGATTFGVAPGATIRACNRGRSWGNAYTAMDWIIQKGDRPAIVSMSFGTQKILSGADTAVDKVVEAGVTVVVAAGNWRLDSCGFSFAYVPSAITVGSSTENDERSSFSNFGTCNDIFGPGSDITSLDYRSDTRTSVKSGTSMATPHVAGAVALLLERNPGMAPKKVKDQLVANAEKGVLQKLKAGDPNVLLSCA